MPSRYPSYDLALRRVENLKRLGYWPGIIGPFPDGWYTLTFDPSDGGDGQ